uniref:THAP domain-containing protein 1 n=1 Tax=Neogobius melanostomus TaxID=47308 RepID=A0A8C6SIE9_9GOBI
MPYHCVAYGCGKTAEDGVTLFKFPKDREEFSKWERQVQRTRPNWVASSASHLCHEHFGWEYFYPGTLKLRVGAVPTVFDRPDKKIYKYLRIQHDSSRRDAIFRSSFRTCSK